MSEPTPNNMPGANADADAAGNNETDTAGTAPSVDWQAEATKWKDLSRKHEKASKEQGTALADLQKRLKVFEDREKTDDQKRQEAVDAALADADAARSEAAQATLRLRRYELVAADDDLPSEVLPLLTGQTDEELADQVAAIKATLSARPRNGLVIHQEGRQLADAKDTDALARQVLLGG